MRKMMELDHQDFIIHEKKKNETFSQQSADPL